MAIVAGMGAVSGAIDAVGAKAAGVGSKTEKKVADIVSKSKPSIAKNKLATTKKTKSGK